MFKSKLDRRHVSADDAFFHDFDKNRTDFPASRREEVEKYQKLNAIRDGKEEGNKKPTIWEGF